jgi:hypothetical protein
VNSLHGGNDSHDNDGGRGNAQADESELPLHNKGDDEGSEEGGNALEEKTKLLGDTGLDQATIRGSLSGDGTTSTKVIVGNFLTKSGAEVLLSDVAYNTVGRVGEEDVPDVGENESTNTEVYKVQSGW